MKKLLFINACIRRDASRTQYIASAIIKNLASKYEIDEIDLTDSPLPPIDSSLSQARGKGDFSELSIEYAEKFANADRIVLAAPFWDMSFPSVVKVFCENISICGITFEDAEDHSTRGRCKAEKLMLITTRGMNIDDESPLDQGTSYMKALGWLWGIDETVVVSAKGLDMCDDDERTARIDSAVQKGLTLCEGF